MCALPSVSNSFYVTCILSYWPPSALSFHALLFLFMSWLTSFLQLLHNSSWFPSLCLPQCTAGTSSCVPPVLVLLCHFNFWTSSFLPSFLLPSHWAAPVATFLVYSTLRAKREKNYLKACPLSEKNELVTCHCTQCPLPVHQSMSEAGCEEWRIHGWCLLCSDYSVLPRAARSRV